MSETLDGFAKRLGQFNALEQFDPAAHTQGLESFFEKRTKFFEYFRKGELYRVAPGKKFFQGYWYDKECLDFNAFAAADDGYVIAISSAVPVIMYRIGLLAAVNSVGFRLLREPYGEARERNTTALKPIELNAMGAVELTPHEGELADAFAYAGDMFIYFHELGHIMNGHVDHLSAAYGLHRLLEVSGDRAENLEGIDLQTLEMNADSYAIQHVLKIMRRLNIHPSLRNPEWEGMWGDGATVTIFCLVAIDFLTKLFDDVLPDGPLSESSHPPFFVRNTYIKMTAQAVLEKEHSLSEEAANSLCMMAAAIGEMAFPENPELAPATFGDDGLHSGAAYLDSLHDRWAVLRPHLVPLKLGPGKLAPVRVKSGV